MRNTPHDTYFDVAIVYSNVKNKTGAAFASLPIGIENKTRQDTIFINSAQFYIKVKFTYRHLNTVQLRNTSKKIDNN